MLAAGAPGAFAQDPPAAPVSRSEPCVDRDTWPCSFPQAARPPP